MLNHFNNIIFVAPLFIMTEKFPFSMNEAEHVLSLTEHMVPSMKRVVYVYYSPKHGQIKAIEATPPYIDPKGFNECILDKNDLAEIQKIREQKNNFKWCSSKELFFITDTNDEADDDIKEYTNEMTKPEKKKHKSEMKNDSQLKTSVEISCHTLMVAVKNEHDNKNDLYFYFYNRNLSNYHIIHASKPLENKDKELIGLKMYNMITLLVETCRSYRQRLKETINDQNNKIEVLKRSLSESRDQNTSHHKALLNYAKEVLEEISAPLSQYVFELSESGCRKLKDYHGDLSFLKEKLQKTVDSKIIQHTDLDRPKDFEIEIAWEFDMERNKETIFIDESDLDFDHIPEPKFENGVKMLGIDSSTIRLFNRLEESAESVKQNGLLVTAYNVGKACKKNMTPPAITFALKKHIDRIKPVLDKYKDRWPIIRKEFKPLINILILIESQAKLDKQA